MKRIALAVVLCAVSSTAAHAGVPTDFDGDGVSDLTRVEIQDDDSLTWKARLSTTQEDSTLGSLGKRGDHIVMAQWLATGTQIGVVSLNSDSGEIVWSILDSAGTKVDKTFGKSGDLVVAGADCNGNGTADAVVVRLENGKAVWQVWYDLFASSTGAPETLTFGQTGDRAFYMRLDDSATDWIGVIRKGSRNRSAARLKNLVTGRVRRFSRLPKFASQGARPRAFPIRLSSGSDVLGFQVTKGGSTRILMYTISGSRVGSVPLDGSGESVVGDFTAGDGYEVGFQGEESSVVFNPSESGVQSVAYLGGVPIDEININVLGTSPTPTPAPDNSGDDRSGGGSNISQCSTIVSWPSGHIYKTIGSEHFFDVRRNTIGIVIKPGGRGPFPSCVKAIDTAGNVVAQLGLYATGSGWAARYYAGVGCGSSTPFNGNAVASRARSKTGSSRVYMNFGGTCYGPIEASRCIGSKQC